MSHCRFTIPTSTVGMGAMYKRHQYKDGKCLRCGRLQFVKVSKIQKEAIDEHGSNS